MFRTSLAVAGVMFCVTGAAVAADPGLLSGSWVERLPNGASMVTEFASSTIYSYALDPSGKRLPAGNKMNVTYRDLDRSSIGIDFQGGGGFMVIVKDPQTIILDFPGVGVHQLTKLQP
jgi:hypothetical protein